MSAFSSHASSLMTQLQVRRQGCEGVWGAAGAAEDAVQQWVDALSWTDHRSSHGGCGLDTRSSRGPVTAFFAPPLAAMYPYGLRQQAYSLASCAPERAAHMLDWQ